MTNAVVVLCTFANQEDALRIAGAVIEARLAACVNILPGVQSIYRWKGEVEQAEEVLALMKTSQQGFSALRDRIKQMHAYETPEIIAVPIVEGLAEYLAWVGEQVS
jgi:periplasmic divalent cation tolerance protein